MRILFTFAGGSGHFDPLLPIAQAAEAAGHAVAFAGRPWMVPKVEALGFTAFPAGSDAGLTPVRRPLAEVDLEKELRDVARGFGRRIARERAADILPICDSWRPDLLVCEEMDLGAMIVAERLALPHATVLVIAAGGFLRPEHVAGPLDEVRAEHGLPPDPELQMVSRYLVLSPLPSSYRDPTDPLPTTAHYIRPFRPFSRAVTPAARPVSPANRTEPPTQPCLAGLSDAPLVYFTLGTVFNVESGDLFTRVLAGLRDLAINVVVTVGRDVDPTELGPQPANVRVERYLPQSEILPHCSLVVSHGGSGSVTGSLAHGLPMVLVPMGADQPLNAARCEALGVAQVLDAVRATPQDVREAVTSVLSTPTCRRAAERLRDEIARLPEPAHAVALLERLARERKPLVAN
jgi:UDP:flavonoid glycosyltransferase YjiC (YdhE family)